MRHQTRILSGHLEDFLTALGRERAGEEAQIASSSHFEARSVRIHRKGPLPPAGEIKFLVRGALASRRVRSGCGVSAQQHQITTYNVCRNMFQLIEPLLPVQRMRCINGFDFRLPDGNCLASALQIEIIKHPHHLESTEILTCCAKPHYLP